MADSTIEFRLTFDGEDADRHELEFYDAAQALIGFERSIALTTHLVLNGQIITQAPSLSGARIVAKPPSAGSWELVALVYLTGRAIYKLGTTPRDTPIGHLISSVYDYMLSNIAGVHVDYESTIGSQLEARTADEHPDLPQHKLDSLTEKCETAISQIHRPIVITNSANRAKILTIADHSERQVGPDLDVSSYEYIRFTALRDGAREIIGRVSSYNSNTYKGRIFVSTEGRPIPFELSEQARDTHTSGVIAESLRQNIVSRGRHGDLKCVVAEFESRTGQLKRYLIVAVEAQT